MTTNRLTQSATSSPKDPQECCDWANARLHPDAVKQGLRWIVNRDPKLPIVLVVAEYR